MDVGGIRYRCVLTYRKKQSSYFALKLQGLKHFFPSSKDEF